MAIFGGRKDHINSINQRRIPVASKFGINSTASAILQPGKIYFSKLDGNAKERSYSILTLGLQIFDMLLSPHHFFKDLVPEIQIELAKHKR